MAPLSQRLKASVFDRVIKDQSDAIQKQKKDFLFRIKRLQAKGLVTDVKVDANSELADIEAVHDELLNKRIEKHGVEKNV